LVAMTTVAILKIQNLRCASTQNGMCLHKSLKSYDVRSLRFVSDNLMWW
jgi:hypothetical protein